MYQALQDDVELLQPQLDYLFALVDGLESDDDSSQQQSQTTALRQRYDTLEAEVGELLTNMETGSSIVAQFQVISLVILE